jgi:hypothetical protein
MTLVPFSALKRFFCPISRIMRGVKKVMSHHFWEHIIKMIIKYKYIMFIPFKKLKLFFHESTSLSAHFFHLGMRRCMPVASNSLLKRRTSSLTLCFGSSSSAERRRRSASFRGPNIGSQWVINRVCRDDEEEHFTQLLQVPLLCT